MIDKVFSTLNNKLGEFTFKDYTNNIDANNLTGGIIHCGTNCLNVPTSYCGVLTLFNLSNDGVQIALAILGNKLYTRTKTRGDWSEWVEK